MSNVSEMTPNAETVAALVEAELAPWIEYADKLERAIETMCGMTKDRLIQMHGEQGLRLVRPKAR